MQQQRYKMTCLYFALLRLLLANAQRRSEQSLVLEAATAELVEQEESKHAM